MSRRGLIIAGTGAAIVAAPAVGHLEPVAAFLAGVYVGGGFLVNRWARRRRDARHGAVSAPLSDAERRAEEIHRARLQTEQARAEALRMRTRPRQLQEEAERRAYIRGATDQARRDAK